jgi:hypothetical protein
VVPALVVLAPLAVPALPAASVRNRGLGLPEPDAKLRASAPATTAPTPIAANHHRDDRARRSLS